MKKYILVVIFALHCALGGGGGLGRLADVWGGGAVII